MCPLWPVHIILLYGALLAPLWLASFSLVGAAANAMSSCDVTYEPEKVSQLKVGETRRVRMTFDKLELQEAYGNNSIVQFNFHVDDANIASVFPESFSVDDATKSENGTDFFAFNVTGSFLGYTKICAKSVDENNNTEIVKCLDVSVIREPRTIDKVFTGSVALLVSIIYINMGAALDMKIVTNTIKKPIGPAIGFMSQFIIMPLLSFGLAKLFIPVAALQLGLFITGCSPGGGASNIWTLAIGGNLDLSITMTTISTFCAFAMMPMWMLTLGTTIFDEAKIAVPYSKIATFAAALVGPLLIGIFIQRKWERGAKFLVKMLKPFSIFLIIFIVTFAIYTNMYLFQLFTWQILLTGMLLPWLGYFLGGGAAWICGQEWRDIIAIGIETGVQNTGLAILALRISLPQPEADLTTALPVAVAIMTPVIPSFIILYQKCRGKTYAMRKEEKKDPLFLPTDDFSTRSSQPDAKSYGSFMRIQENSSFVASTATLTENIENEKE